MIIDKPQTKNIPQLRHLWQEAFGDEDAFLDSFFTTGYCPDRCRCISFDGRIAAALYWFDCYWEEKKLAYIYAVATDKVFRGRGLCRMLMEDTHKHLQALGYCGAVLVPGNPGLFDLYEKLGYVRFCPMQTVTAEPAAQGVPLTPLSSEAFCQIRRNMLPAGGILQEGDTLSFLACFTEFYAGQDSLMCLSREADTLYFQEYLGPVEALPGVLATLGAKKALVRIPGGDPYAMYLPLDSSLSPPDYLGISLG